MLMALSNLSVYLKSAADRRRPLPASVRPCRRYLDKLLTVAGVFVLLQIRTSTDNNDEGRSSTTNRGDKTKKDGPTLSRPGLAVCLFLLKRQPVGRPTSASLQLAPSHYHRQRWIVQNCQRFLPAIFRSPTHFPSARWRTIT